MRVAHPVMKMAVCAVVGATALAACSKSATNNVAPTIKGAFGKVPAQTGTPHAGTITVAEPPGATPTWIFPVTPGANGSVYTAYSFQYEMWRPTSWFPNGSSQKEDPAMSLASKPQWNSTDTTVTIKYKNWKWSDGKPLTSRDAMFFIDMTKAAVKVSPADYSQYTPHVGIPDQIVSMSTPDSHTLVLHLNKKVNPIWFWEDSLAGVQPLPSHAWSKASANGPILDFTNPANAAKIYKFLAAQSKSVTTYATNPLWKVVDGPYTLTSFNNTTGAYTMVPNKSYSGPHSANQSTLQAVPFTSDTAEWNAVKAGSIDSGYVPFTNLPQVKSIEGKYHVFGYPGFGFNYVAFNFKDHTGDFNNIIKQLYIRQAIAHLEDEAGYIKAFFFGARRAGLRSDPADPAEPVDACERHKEPVPVQRERGHQHPEDPWMDSPPEWHRRVRGRQQVRRWHPEGHQAGVEPDLQHLAGDHRPADHRPGLAGEEGRHPDHAEVRQLQPHDRYLLRRGTAEERQPLGDGGLRRVQHLHVPDHERHLQLRRYLQHRRLLRPEGR